MGRLEIVKSLPLSPRAPGTARGLLEDLTPLVPEPVLDGVRLVASELVTNAVKHSGLTEGAPIEFRIAADPRRVRLEVCDHGRGFTAGIPDPEVPSGWGFHLVEGFADRWGFQDNDHTTAWAEFDLTS